MSKKNWKYKRMNLVNYDELVEGYSVLSGTEVKPGKPFTHIFDGLKGRLHISVESEEVIFSVIGPRSVHLSGYYLGGHRHRNLDDNSESYGEDIADSETQRSVNSEEDKYDDSFIDDDDPKFTHLLLFLIVETTYSCSSTLSLEAYFTFFDSDSGYLEEVLNKKRPQNGRAAADDLERCTN
ncbi:unnamed protein product [Prunus armeniaca]|uniref:Nucleoplasmin-like domain-containing protein n=1 Tax=Prunus armeniaca TaxID=36596 RepID=A0A6J5U2A6_PRUAR|nr:unnamed protein product [Prunus armeniaca]